jgi:hypothetical protein
MPETLIDKKEQKHHHTCCCPACAGLECIERPRYFAGQLLTEAELNSEQAYVRAKNRLQNRYLHGWGVVCGLQVVCNDCDGWVTVKQGYAIDPCGEDVIVWVDQPFDVLKAIRDLCIARRRRRKGDCDPYVPPQPPSCRGIEEHWCITLAYEEKEARPTTTLRQGGESCGCCSGSEPCGCGCHHVENTGMRSKAICGYSSSGSTNGRSRTFGACEPTRILEGYRLGVIEEPPECAPPPPTDRDESLLKQLSARIPDDTLLMRIINCFTSADTFARKRLSASDLQLLSDIAVSVGPISLPQGVSAQTVHDALCRLRQAVIDIYLESPHNVRCQLLNALDQITCRPPNPDETAPAYTTAMQPSIQHLFALLIQYFLDSFCHALLPPCSTDPCDNRLILACLTIKDDKIVDICNFSCRRFAGAFPSWFYWLSAVPIVPALKVLFQKVCCGKDLVHANSPLVNELMGWLNRIDPSGRARRALVEGNFAIPKNFAQEIGAAMGKVSLAGLTGLARPDAVNLPTLIGTPAEDAANTLKGAGVAVSAVREVKSADESRRLKNLTLNPLAARGDKIVLYRAENKVVGFGPYDVNEQLADNEAKLQSLSQELEALKRQVSALSPPDDN